MGTFKIFNTLSQMRNYSKKVPLNNYDNMCGCCFNREIIKIDGKKLLFVKISSHKGIIKAECKVIGRLKTSIKK